MVLSHRQIASAFKPVLYGTALENGCSPCTYLQNIENLSGIPKLEAQKLQILSEIHFIKKISQKQKTSSVKKPVKSLSRSYSK